MNIHQKLSASVIGAAIIHLVMRPDQLVGALFVLAAIALYGFTILQEQRQDQELDAVKAQVKELSDKIQGLLIARGLGR